MHGKKYQGTGKSKLDKQYNNKVKKHSLNQNERKGQMNKRNG